MKGKISFRWYIVKFLFQSLSEFHAFYTLSRNGTIRRGRFGASDSAQPFRRWDCSARPFRRWHHSAQGCFGAGRFGAGMIWRRDVSALADSAQGCFGAGRFGAVMIRRCAGFFEIYFLTRMLIVLPDICYNMLPNNFRHSVFDCLSLRLSLNGKKPIWLK